MENNEMIEAAPILFRPYFKQVIWGGSRICAYKDCPQTVSRVGESWEISALPGRETVVASGTYKGMTLTELAGRFGAQLLGSGVRGRFGDRFPLLLKFIDANDNLSVQVHPDDATAMSHHNSPGKTEMWYVISAEPGAKVYVGLNSDITPAEFDRRVADNTFTEVLAEHEVAPGDVFFLPPGRVHAIGAGVLLAEIQESSDTT
ncbi:MAG: class I mannose-6-phosphate isomerase, partial [Muribaculaceae bacterium]|nr:class I mannose-6-phosphate isomerase [Muribaculaceae bacterium]